MGQTPKILLLVLAEALCCGVVAASFWLEDLRFSLPTPRPANLVEPPMGDRVELCESLATALGDRDAAPSVLHFFNPSCPCSRFNLDHLRRLVHAYGSRVRFVAILEGDDAAAALAAFDNLDVGIDALPDGDGRIAASLGVYATPQAVVLDAADRVYFRGNYNASRYCVDRETEFVRIAIESCLAGKAPPRWPSIATTAQGCELPANLLDAGYEEPR